MCAVLGRREPLQGPWDRHWMKVYVYAWRASRDRGMPRRSASHSHSYFMVRMVPLGHSYVAANSATNRRGGRSASRRKALLSA